MKANLLIYGIALLLLVIIDGIWLGFVIKNFVMHSVGHLMEEKVDIVPALFFYPLYALGITVFVVLPAISGGFSPWKVFLMGSLLGLVAYGAYDLTNAATLKDWPLSMTVLDMGWGTLLTGSVSAGTFYLTTILLKLS